MDQEKFLADCRRIGSSTWSDALDDLGISGVIRDIPQRSGEGSFAGFAVTVKESTGKKGTFQKSEMGISKIFAETQPGQVLMFDMGGADISTFGGLAAFAIVRSRAAAVIVDGGCRDLGEIRANGLWLAARHVTPITGKTRVRVDTVDEPITVGGVRVCQGDLVVGDETGVAVVPRAQIEKVKTIAEEKRAVDNAVEVALKSGLDFATAASKAKYL